jgi:hypothetical protein
MSWRAQHIFGRSPRKLAYTFGGGGVVNSRAFFSFFPCNHKYKNNNFLFPAKQKTAQFLPFIFCFTRELAGKRKLLFLYL